MASRRTKVTDVETMRPAQVLGSDHDERSLIAVLEDLQMQYRYLPRDALILVSEKLGVPLSQVYSVATFYNAFTLKPRGKYLIQVCLGTACHVRGSKHVLEEVCRLLGVKPGETTDDRLFTVETVNCLGACALGPIMVVEGEYSGQMTAAKVAPVLAKCAEAEAQRENP
jgi:NADH-quinone oxidoreductase subunit E